MKFTVNLFFTVLSLISAVVQADTAKPMAFETIDKGSYSHYQENNNQHILEIYQLQQWQKFWTQHQAGTSPLPELPKIDFQAYFVIVALDEIRSSGGYTIEITQVDLDAASANRPVRIILQAGHPGSATMTASAITRPYHIIKIKK